VGCLRRDYARNAAAITRYYADAAEPARRTGFLLLAMLGASLVGAGIALLVAHNWVSSAGPFAPRLRSCRC